MSVIYRDERPSSKSFHEVRVYDEPGSGGGHHHYGVVAGRLGDGYSTELPIPSFQNGPIQQVGVNGIHNEDLIAILIHRMQGFQSGEYACRENALALTKLQEAQHWLAHRTQARELRGVEGTHAV